MRAITVFFLSLFLGVSYVSADYDPALEAKEAAARVAADRANQEKNAKAERKVAAARAKQDAALAQDKHQRQDNAAVGKSDAQARLLYDEKVKAGSAAAASAASGAKRVTSDPGTNVQMKTATGKSMQEIVEMSPEEQQAWAAEMEKKMNKGK